MGSTFGMISVAVYRELDKVLICLINSILSLFAFMHQ